MTGKQLAVKMWKNFGVSEEEINGLFALIVAEVTAGRKATIPGFGTFFIRSRSERMGRNPRTGEALLIPAKNSLAFKPAKDMRDL